MPAYHHLDISYALDNRKGKGSSWVFGIYNLCARKNPSVIYHKQTREGDYGLEFTSICAVRDVGYHFQTTTPPSLHRGELIQAFFTSV